MISSILEVYGVDCHLCLVEPLTGGLINRTWKITKGDRQYILQRINDSVFKDPVGLSNNIRLLREYINGHNPGYLFVSPVKNRRGEELVYDPAHGYFRLFPFIKGSHTINVVATPGQAYEASFQFGKFTRLFSGFDVAALRTTIPDFHNLILRYRLFEEAMTYGNKERIKQSKEIIEAIRRQLTIVRDFEKIGHSKAIRKRVTHHDTKISNVLFNDQGKGICVIDLDTVMPGYFISDVGDMMRTYLSPASEEEGDFDKIEIRDDFFRAIVQGYLSNMNSELTDGEHNLIFYSGLFMTYMQAIRFLTDHVKDDAYYGAAYEGHNLVRATNQVILLQRLIEKEQTFRRIIAGESRSKMFFSIL